MLVLLDVVGSSCGALPTTPTRTSAAHLNTRLGLLKMGIMMPKTCSESIDNKHLTVASCWFSLSLQSAICLDDVHITFYLAHAV